MDPHSELSGMVLMGMTMREMYSFLGSRGKWSSSCSEFSDDIFHVLVYLLLVHC